MQDFDKKLGSKQNSRVLTSEEQKTERGETTSGTASVSERQVIAQEQDKQDQSVQGSTMDSVKDKNQAQGEHATDTNGNKVSKDNQEVEKTNSSGTSPLGMPVASATQNTHDQIQGSKPQLSQQIPQQPMAQSGQFIQGQPQQQFNHQGQMQYQQQILQQQVLQNHAQPYTQAQVSNQAHNFAPNQKWIGQNLGQVYPQYTQNYQSYQGLPNQGQHNQGYQGYQVQPNQGQYNQAQLNQGHFYQGQGNYRGQGQMRQGRGQGGQNYMQPMRLGELFIKNMAEIGLNDTLEARQKLFKIAWRRGWIDNLPPHEELENFINKQLDKPLFDFIQRINHSFGRRIYPQMLFSVNSDFTATLDSNLAYMEGNYSHDPIFNPQCYDKILTAEDYELSAKIEAEEADWPHYMKGLSDFINKQAHYPLDSSNYTIEPEVTIRVKPEIDYYLDEIGSSIFQGDNQDLFFFERFYLYNANISWVYDGPNRKWLCEEEMSLFGILLHEPLWAMYKIFSIRGIPSTQWPSLNYMLRQVLMMWIDKGLTLRFFPPYEILLDGVYRSLVLKKQNITKYKDKEPSIEIDRVLWLYVFDAYFKNFFAERMQFKTMFECYKDKSFPDSEVYDELILKVRLMQRIGFFTFEALGSNEVKHSAVANSARFKQKSTNVAVDNSFVDSPDVHPNLNDAVRSAQESYEHDQFNIEYIPFFEDIVEEFQASMDKHVINNLDPKSDDHVAGSNISRKLDSSQGYQDPIGQLGQVWHLWQGSMNPMSQGNAPRQEIQGQNNGYNQAQGNFYQGAHADYTQNSQRQGNFNQGQSHYNQAQANYTLNPQTQGNYNYQGQGNYNQGTQGNYNYIRQQNVHQPQPYPQGHMRGQLYQQELQGQQYQQGYMGSQALPNQYRQQSYQQNGMQQNYQLSYNQQYAPNGQNYSQSVPQMYGQQGMMQGQQVRPQGGTIYDMQSHQSMQSNYHRQGMPNNYGMQSHAMPNQSISNQGMFNNGMPNNMPNGMYNGMQKAQRMQSSQGFTTNQSNLGVGYNQSYNNLGQNIVPHGNNYQQPRAYQVKNQHVDARGGSTVNQRGLTQNNMPNQAYGFQQYSSNRQVSGQVGYQNYPQSQVYQGAQVSLESQSYHELPNTQSVQSYQDESDVQEHVSHDLHDVQIKEDVSETTNVGLVENTAQDVSTTVHKSHSEYKRFDHVEDEPLLEEVETHASQYAQADQETQDIASEISTQDDSKVGTVSDKNLEISNRYGTKFLSYFEVKTPSEDLAYKHLYQYGITTPEQIDEFLASLNLTRANQVRKIYCKVNAIECTLDRREMWTCADIALKYIHNIQPQAFSDSEQERFSKTLGFDKAVMSIYDYARKHKIPLEALPSFEGVLRLLVETMIRHSLDIKILPSFDVLFHNVAQSLCDLDHTLITSTIRSGYYSDSRSRLPFAWALFSALEDVAIHGLPVKIVDTYKDYPVYGDYYGLLRRFFFKLALRKSWAKSISFNRDYYKPNATNCSDYRFNFLRNDFDCSNYNMEIISYALSHYLERISHRPQPAISNAQGYSFSDIPNRPTLVESVTGFINKYNESINPHDLGVIHTTERAASKTMSTVAHWPYLSTEEEPNGTHQGAAPIKSIGENTAYSVDAEVTFSSDFDVSAQNATLSRAIETASTQVASGSAVQPTENVEDWQEQTITQEQSLEAIEYMQSAYQAQASQPSYLQVEPRSLMESKLQVEPSSAPAQSEAKSATTVSKESIEHESHNLERKALVESTQPMPQKKSSRVAHAYVHTHVFDLPTDSDFAVHTAVHELKSQAETVEQNKDVKIPLPVELPEGTPTEVALDLLEYQETSSQGQAIEDKLEPAVAFEAQVSYEVPFSAEQELVAESQVDELEVQSKISIPSLDASKSQVDNHSQTGQDSDTNHARDNNYKVRVRQGSQALQEALVRSEDVQDEGTGVAAGAQLTDYAKSLAEDVQSQEESVSQEAQVEEVKLNTQDSSVINVSQANDDTVQSQTNEVYTGTETLETIEAQKVGLAETEHKILPNSDNQEQNVSSTDNYQELTKAGKPRKYRTQTKSIEQSKYVIPINKELLEASRFAQSIKSFRSKINYPTANNDYTQIAGAVRGSSMAVRMQLAETKFHISPDERTEYDLGFSYATILHDPNQLLNVNFKRLANGMGEAISLIGEYSAGRGYKAEDLDYLHPAVAFFRSYVPQGLTSENAVNAANAAFAIVGGMRKTDELEVAKFVRAEFAARNIPFEDQIPQLVQASVDAEIEESYSVSDSESAKTATNANSIAAKEESSDLETREREYLNQYAFIPQLKGAYLASTVPVTVGSGVSNNSPYMHDRSIQVAKFEKQSIADIYHQQQLENYKNNGEIAEADAQICGVAPVATAEAVRNGSNVQPEEEDPSVIMTILGPSDPKKPAKPHEPNDFRRAKVNTFKTFDNFVPSPQTTNALDVAKKIVASPGMGHTPFFVHSAAGRGKTHLIQAIANGLKQTHPELVVNYIRAEDFIFNYVSTVKQFNDMSYKKKTTVANSALFRDILDSDVVIVDDIQNFAKAEKSRDAFFEVIAIFMEQPNHQLILAADVPPRSLIAQGFNPRLTSRFAAGVCYELLMPNVGARRTIVSAKSSEIGIKFSETLIDYLADNLNRNVREIEGAVKSISASIFSNGGVSLRNAAGLVSSYIPLPKNLKEEPDPEDSSNLPEQVQSSVIINDSINLEVVKKVVARAFKISPVELVAKTKRKELSTARSMAMLLAKELVHKVTLCEIGISFKRDHSSVIEAIQRLRHRLANDADLRHFHDFLVNKILHPELEDEVDDMESTKEQQLEAPKTKGKGRGKGKVKS